MITDLKSFIERERPSWDKLEKELERLREGFSDLSDLRYLKEVLGLFQRASSDLAHIQSSAAEPELKQYLENLVGTAYAEIHSSKADLRNFRPIHWFFNILPQTFRRQIWAFWVSLILTLVGAMVGALLLAFDVEGREAIYAFGYLAETPPKERVALEETGKVDRNRGKHAQFASFLMNNNIRVSIFSLALGITAGVGTVYEVVGNGVQLGAVVFDYLRDGQVLFMIGWLLPHGSFEIPALLIAGQGGFVLARAVIGWNTHLRLRARLRQVMPDIATLGGGAAVMLVWAGIVESFFSQYHEPVIPYVVKITFGAVELAAVTAFYFYCGKKSEAEAAAPAPRP